MKWHATMMTMMMMMMMMTGIFTYGTNTYRYSFRRYSVRTPTYSSSCSSSSRSSCTTTIMKTWLDGDSGSKSPRPQSGRRRQVGAWGVIRGLFLSTSSITILETITLHTECKSTLGCVKIKEKYTQFCKDYTHFRLYTV